MQRGHYLTILMCAVTLAGCRKIDDAPELQTMGFIRVIDESGQPVDSAKVLAFQSESDPTGEYPYNVLCITDSDGKTSLRSDSFGRLGRILKSGYFPRSANIQRDSTYILTRTPHQAIALGPVEGNRYLLHPNGLIALDDDGDYRFYKFENDHITLSASAEFDFGEGIREAFVDKSSLWVQIKWRILLRINVENPDLPLLAQILNFPYSSFDAVEDYVLLSAGVRWVDVLELVGDSVVERSSIPTWYAPQVRLHDRKLMMVNRDGWWGYDITDLARPVLTSPNRTNKPEVALFGDSLMAIRTSGAPGKVLSSVDLFDLRDPSLPVFLRSQEFPGYLLYSKDFDHCLVDYRRFEFFPSCYYYASILPGETTPSISGFSETGLDFADLPYVVSEGVLYRWE